jgi:hypothetical protein
VYKFLWTISRVRELALKDFLPVSRARTGMKIAKD